MAQALRDRRRIVLLFLILAASGPARAELVVFSAGGVIDTFAEARGLFEGGEEFDSDDPSEIDWDFTDLPFTDSQTALAEITATTATATATQSIEFGADSIRGSGSIAVNVDGDPLGFSEASASARSQFTVRFDITDAVPYSFSGSLTDMRPSNVIAPSPTTLFLVQQGGTFSNAVEASNSTETFSFSGVLDPGRYRLSILGVTAEGRVITTGFEARSLSQSGTYDFQLQVIPLPAGAWLLLSALTTLGWLRRRRC